LGLVCCSARGLCILIDLIKRDIITSYFTNPDVILAKIPEIINCTDPAQITTAETALETAKTALTLTKNAIEIAQSKFDDYTLNNHSAGGIDFGGSYLGMSQIGQNLYKTLKNLQETESVSFDNVMEASETLNKLKDAACGGS